MTPNRLCTALLTIVVAAGLVACGDDDTVSDGDETRGPATVRLLTHDSFYLSDDVLETFTDETGIEVELLQGGDAGTVVNQAILSKGRPQADVLFGVDSTFLSRALEEDIFIAHEADGLDGVDDALRLDPEHRVTPIDYGDVCINYDRRWFDRNPEVPVPATLDDLTDERYRDLLVVQNPATSSPGLAFLLASIAAFGEEGWQDWWRALRANGVLVVDGWERAYNREFSGGSASEGDRPLVVSYASSPPAEVVYADPPVDEPPTGVMESSCYRQVEFAGVLQGTDNEDEATQLVDFMLGDVFQADLPLSMFVFPARSDVELPDVFDDHAARPADPFELDADRITEHRERWIDEWTDLVVR
jgi:thiamine transport system substrate-binding protein